LKITDCFSLCLFPDRFVSNPYNTNFTKSISRWTKVLCKSQNTKTSLHVDLENHEALIVLQQQNQG